MSAEATVDQKRAVLKIKHELEPFRSAIVGVYDVVTWEKQYYAGIVFGTVSFIFLMLWYMDLTCITLFSLLGLLFVILNMTFSTLSRLLFNNENWSSEHETKFEVVCSKVFNLKANVLAWSDYLMKQRKSAVFIIIISFGLLLMAWIGATFNNLLLMYLVTVILVMWPGMRDNNVLKSVTKKASDMINEKMGKAKLQ